MFLPMDAGMQHDLLVPLLILKQPVRKVPYRFLIVDEMFYYVSAWEFSVISSLPLSVNPHGSHTDAFIENLKLESM